MSQISFAEAEQASNKKLTCREIFLQEMEQVIPWKAFVKLIEPHYPVAGRGRKPYPLESMLRVHLMQNFFMLSDPAMEDALYDTPWASSREGTEGPVRGCAGKFRVAGPCQIERRCQNAAKVANNGTKWRNP